MKIHNNQHIRLSLKITFFGVSFLAVFFSFFLLFSFLYLLDTEGRELKSISQIQLGVSSNGIIVSGGSKPVILSGNMVIDNMIESGISTGKTLEGVQKLPIFGRTGAITVSATVSTIPQVLLGEYSDLSPLPFQGQRIFELTRDSLVETKEGNLIKNGIFNYDSFDIPYLLKQKKDIFTEKIVGEYYLFYKINSEGDIYLFAQNVNYIFLFIYKSLFICSFCLILFSFSLFFLSKYLVQLFMKPIEENNARLKEYNHNLAHEIKTPLTVMTLNLGFLENNQNQEIIASSKEEIFKIKNITDTLLFLSENFVMKQKEFVSLATLIESYKNKNSEQHQNIEFINKSTNSNISIDINMFERLLKNLIENAFKYSSDQKVSITLEKDVIIFSNNVINDIDTSKLFDIFFQGDNSRTSEGYGLGLALVKRIVDIFGWNIQVKSSHKIFEVIINIG